MRRTAGVLFLGVVLLGLGLPARAAPTFVTYEGTWQQVTFLGSHRVVTPMRLQVLTTPGGGPAGHTLRPLTLIALIPSGKKAALEYRVVSAFVDGEKAIYLGLRGAGSLVLYLDMKPIPPPAPRVRARPLNALLLLSSGNQGAITVRGTYRVQPRLPGAHGRR